MLRTNNQTNQLIQLVVVAADFLLLNLALLAAVLMGAWQPGGTLAFVAVCNLAMTAAEWQFPPIVHQRMISAGELVRRIVLLTVTQALVAYVGIKVTGYQPPVGRVLFGIGTGLFAMLLLSRFAERMIIKRFRALGRNTRMVTFVGADEELAKVYSRLINDSTTGYRFLGYYADVEMAGAEIAGVKFTKLGSIKELTAGLKDGSALVGDELYLCVSRREGDLIRALSKYCERHMVRFYYVPVAEEAQRVNLRREDIEDMEIYAAYESPLMLPANKITKRVFDILFSSLFLAFTAWLYPIISLIIKLQSPGPVFFSQDRTGLDGKTFRMLKFRSMHVNDEADTLQATKDDPRKFPFGDFMRHTNIDELPQFWNVLLGDMSIVGPRPHMLAHTEMYSELIDKYMVRHFIKPGITGWAQVMGYRGETRELWQMEGRVKRDIWYMEHWTMWLDIRIIWLTVKSMLVSRNEGAY